MSTAHSPSGGAFTAAASAPGHSSTRKSLRKSQSMPLLISMELPRSPAAPSCHLSRSGLPSAATATTCPYSQKAAAAAPPDGTSRKCCSATGSCTHLDQLHSSAAQHPPELGATSASDSGPHRQRCATASSASASCSAAKPPATAVSCAANHHHHHQQQKPRRIAVPAAPEVRSAPYNLRFVTDLRQLLTLRQHYYPEGGWGWVLVAVCFAVQCISHGLHLAAGVSTLQLATEYRMRWLEAVWLTSASFAVGLGFSPVTVSLCKRKSTRLVAVLGGLVAALGCLFTSFAARPHQVACSWALMLGLGVNLTRDCSTVAVAQYFKKRRELVEVAVVAGSGAGLVGMTGFLQRAVAAWGWRLGLQAIAATIFATFILGLFYRSASLYHPQRRAILHLKNQRRKVKDKNKQSNRAPFFDLRTLQSKTVRYILLSTACTSLGLYAPLFLLARDITAAGFGSAGVFNAHAALGVAWMLGAAVCGFLVVRSSRECRIGRQNLCQLAACLAAVAQLTLAANRQPTAESYVMFGAVYGGAIGGWHYSLKVYTYDRVRARNFARAWSFVQASQALPIACGVPLAAWLSELCQPAGYVWGAVCTLLGAALLFLVDVHKRRIQRKLRLQQAELEGCEGGDVTDSSTQAMKSETFGSDGGGGGGGGGGVGGSLRQCANPAQQHLQQIFRTASTRSGPTAKLRRLSFSNEPENDAPFPYRSHSAAAAAAASAAAAAKAVAKSRALTAASATATALLLNSELLLHQMSDELMPDLGAVAAAAAAVAAAAAAAAADGAGEDSDGDADKAELTCISEEGIADMDLPDNLFEDFDYIGDCITSCNKVENYLMLSEFENNLNVELPSSIHSRGGGGGHHLLGQSSSSTGGGGGHLPCPNVLCPQRNNI